MGSIIAWVTGLSNAGKAWLAVGSFFAMGTVGNIVAPEEPEEATQPRQQQVEVSEQTTLEPVQLVETKTETTTEVIPYETTEQEDATLDSGSQLTSVSGVNGERTITFEVTYTDGIETDRRQVSNEVTTQPVNEVILIGTYVAPIPEPAATPPGCDPNYSGCVPIDSDVDCAGGRGNGPSYAVGPVTVIGTDIYGLDGDGDGIGCE